VSTTKDTPFSFGSKLSIATRVPSSFITDDCIIASRGLIARACRDGDPDILEAFPHPQSAASVANRRVLARLLGGVNATGANELDSWNMVAAVRVSATATNRFGAMANAVVLLIRVAKEKHDVDEPLPLMSL